jgi:hypothetical protein
MSKPKVQINVKFEAPRPSREGGTGTPGLPGSVISFYIVPLDPAHSAGSRGTFRSKPEIIILRFDI